MVSYALCGTGGAVSTLNTKCNYITNLMLMHGSGLCKLDHAKQKHLTHYYSMLYLLNV